MQKIDDFYIILSYTRIDIVVLRFLNNREPRLPSIPKISKKNFEYSSSFYFQACKNSAISTQSRL